MITYTFHSKSGRKWGFEINVSLNVASGTTEEKCANVTWQIGNILA